MRFWRWPLLFLAVYGSLWIHSRLKTTPEPSSHADRDTLPVPEIGEPDAPALEQMLSEDPRSESSLSYAFAKFGEAEPENDFEAALTRIKSLRDEPTRLQHAVQEELARLDSSQIVERSILLREAYLAFDRHLSPEMGLLLENERQWAAENAPEITDPATLQGYLAELTRFSVQNAETAPSRIEILSDLIQKFSENPTALSAIRSSILQHAEWDLPELIRRAPASAQDFLKGNSP
jgi:hypothetical protein